MARKTYNNGGDGETYTISPRFSSTRLCEYKQTERIDPKTFSLTHALHHNDHERTLWGISI